MLHGFESQKLLKKDISVRVWSFSDNCQKCVELNFVLFKYFWDKICPDVSPLWSTSKGGQVYFPTLHKTKGIIGTG